MGKPRTFIPPRGGTAYLVKDCIGELYVTNELTVDSDGDFSTSLLGAASVCYAAARQVFGGRVLASLSRNEAVAITLSVGGDIYVPDRDDDEDDE